MTIKELDEKFESLRLIYDIDDWNYIDRLNTKLAVRTYSEELYSSVILIQLGVDIANFKEIDRWEFIDSATDPHINIYPSFAVNFDDSFRWVLDLRNNECFMEREVLVGECEYEIQRVPEIYLSDDELKHIKIFEKIFLD